MRRPRTLRFVTEADVIADVEKLLAGASTDGTWSLVETCWHLHRPLIFTLRQPARLAPTPDEKAIQDRFDRVLEAGEMPGGIPAPPGTDPAGMADPNAVADYISGLRLLAAYSNDYVDFGRVGPMRTDKFRQFNFVHAAHHLKLLHPANA